MDNQSNKTNQKQLESIFQSEKPIQNSNEDKLNRKKFAKSLASAIEAYLNEKHKQSYAIQEK